MKRKSNQNQNISIKTFKRKDTMSCYSVTSEKDHSIYDFFSLIQPKISKKTAIDKQIPIVPEATKRKFLGSKYILVKNPSKHQIKTSECVFPEAKYSNIISEDKIDGLVVSFERVIAEFKSAFTSRQFSPYSFKEEDFANFITKNLSNILIKYLLQLDNNLLFIPRGFIKSISDKSPINQSDKEMAKLISGFDDSKQISLKYSPINITEAKQTSKGLCDTLINYLNNFTNPSSTSPSSNTNGYGNQGKESKKPPMKALVIYNPEDYLQFIKLIETICTNVGYETIRIDELEPQKVARIKVLSEATKSQRLSSLSEDLIYKMNIIESIVNYHKAKWHNLTQINNEENTLAMSETTIDSSENNSTQSSTDPTFIKFQQNIHEIFIAKKTMLLIVDSFRNEDEDKPYIANMISRIPTTKCPIVLLTNNIRLLTANQNFMKHFLFYHLTNNSNKQLNREREHHVIFLASIVLFIHLYFSNAKEALTNEEKSKTFYDSFLIKQLSEVLKNDVLRIKMINDKICFRIVKIAIVVSLKHHFCIEEVLFEYSRLLRSISHFQLTNDKDELLKVIESKVSCDHGLDNQSRATQIGNSNDIIYEGDDEDENGPNDDIAYDNDKPNNDYDSDNDLSFIDINDSLLNEMNALNELSFEDNCLGRIGSIANKSYSYKYKFKTYDKEDVNIEDIYLKQALRFNTSEKTSRNLSLINTYNDKDLKKIALEDKRFFSNTINSPMPFITFSTLPFYHSVIKSIKSLSEKQLSKALASKVLNKQFHYETISTLTMINNKRKPKSVQRKERSLLEKVLGKANDDQINRYLQVHDFSHMVTKFKQNYFANYNRESINHYYRHSKAIDKLKPNRLASSIRMLNNDDSRNDNDNDINYNILRESVSYSKKRHHTQL